MKGRMSSLYNYIIDQYSTMLMLLMICMFLVMAQSIVPVIKYDCSPSCRIEFTFDFPIQSEYLLESLTNSMWNSFD